MSASAQVPFDTAPPLPRRETFENGDLLWPKKPGAFVPYNQRSDTDVERDRELWESEKRAFLERARREGTYLSPEQLSTIENLDYREFLARYHGDQQPGVPGLYSSGGGLYVGHVAIVEIDPIGVISIIEALGGQGIVRTRYDDWLAHRPGEVVWHGRLRDRSPADRAKISTEAGNYLKRPYDFWNLDLNDDAAFYCSKLVWLATFRSLDFAVDGNLDPKRGFWFSPKQLLYLPSIVRLHDPGPYAML